PAAGNARIVGGNGRTGQRTEVRPTPVGGGIIAHQAIDETRVVAGAAIRSGDVIGKAAVLNTAIVSSAAVARGGIAEDGIAGDGRAITGSAIQGRVAAHRAAAET